MTESVAEHIEKLGGVATSSQLKEAGYAPGVIEYALNSGRIDRLTRGVYCSLDVLSYHPATVLAEKLETVLSRGEANTRGRDFYDLYAIPRYYAGSISEQDLRKALLHTAEKQGSLQAIADWQDMLESIRSSAIMHQVWFPMLLMPHMLRALLLTIRLIQSKS